ncbi:MAG: CHAT domain-containing protein [Phaeodactylibacter sp.]|nr:CHAT domain-containing protein [Phaeodactylibacter sp.]
MRPFISTVVLFCLLNTGTAGQSTPIAKPGPETPEAEWLARLEKHIGALFDDLSLSWGDIGEKLAKLEQLTAERYGCAGISCAFVIHKSGVARANDKDYPGAIEKYREAFQIRVQLAGSRGGVLMPEIIRGCNNIGNCYLKMEEPYLALEWLPKGLDYINNYAGRDNMLLLHQDITFLTARAYGDIGDLDNALKYYEASEGIALPPGLAEDEKKQYYERKARALTARAGMLANRLGRMEQAINHLGRAENLIERGRREKIAQQKASIYHNLGIAYEKRGEWPKAITAYQKSVFINDSLSLTQALIFDYNNLGVTYKKMWEERKEGKYLLLAKQNLQSALRLIEASSKPLNGLDLVYDNLGDIACLEGNLAEGIKRYNQAMQEIVPSFTPRKPEDNPELIRENIVDKTGLLITLASKAKVQAAQYLPGEKLELALRTYEKMDSLIDMIRFEFQPDASKESLVEKVKPLYEQAIELCWRLYDASGGSQKYAGQAFTFSEKSRSIILLDAVRRLRANFELPPGLAKSEQDLNLKINYYEKQLALLGQTGSEDSARKAELTNKLLESRRLYDSKLKEIREANPSYFDLKFNHQTLSLREFSKQLGRRQTFLEYFVGDSAVFVFVANRNKAPGFVRIGLDFPLRDWVEALNLNLRQQSLDLEPGYQIYQKLFAPLEDRKLLAGELIIVPDDVLGYVSFDMLPSHWPGTDGFSLRTFEDYLLYNYQISYLYSATLGKESFSLEGKGEMAFLGVAPSFEKNFKVAGYAFEALDWRDIMEGIKSLYGPNSKLLFGKKIAADSFSHYAPHYRILHLATHALANDSLGNLSFILLSEEEGGLLYAKDLYRLKLNADMAVLTTCQGAAGELQKGEGIISLARGFFYAGCASVIPTLWTAREDVSKELMIRFYEYLDQGKPKDKALRQAKLDYLKQLEPESGHLAHPYYWAAFIPMGNMAPLSRPCSSLWLLAILAAAALSYWLLRRRFRPA